MQSIPSSESSAHSTPSDPIAEIIAGRRPLGPNVAAFVENQRRGIEALSKQRKQSPEEVYRLYDALHSQISHKNPRSGK